MSTKGKRKRIRILLGLLVLGLGISLSSPVTSLALQMPVFKLVAPEVERERATSILTDLHEGRLPPGAEAEDRAKVFIYRAGKKELEIYKASGGIFIRDVEQLWNPRLKPTLPSQDKAKRLADKFLADNKLLPDPDPRVKVSFSGYSETAGAAVDDLGKVEEKKILDVQVNYKVSLSVEGTEGQRYTLPVVGGGGKFKVVIGQGDSVIGYHGVWRPIAEVASREEILPQVEAEAKFKKMVGNLKVTKIESFLAYYSAPIFEEQTYLAPVWVVKAEAEIAGKKVPLRNTIIAATKYGPKWPEIPAIKRTKEDKRLPRRLDKDEHVGSQRESLLDLLSTSVTDKNKQKTFLNMYVEHKGPIDEFWQTVRKKKIFRNERELEDLQFTLQVGAVTHNHIRLVNQLQVARRTGKLIINRRTLEVKSLQDLAKLDRDDWLKLIDKKVNGKPVGVPSDIPGKGKKQKENYADVLVRIIEDTFPNEVIANRIERKNRPEQKELVKFLKENVFKEKDRFDFATTNIDSYLQPDNARALSGISDPDSLINQLKGIQRVYKLAPRYSEMGLLMADGIHSAHCITRMGENVFLKKYSEKLGMKQALVIYEKAQQQKAKDEENRDVEEKE